MSIVTALCPLCDSTEFRLAYPATIGQVDLEPGSYFGSGRAHAGHFDIVDCARCGLRIQNPRDDGETLGAAYAHLEGLDEEQLVSAGARAASRQLELTRRFVPCPADLLDVGAGAGVFARAASQAGYRVSALEPSEALVAHARVLAPDVRWIEGSLESATLPAQSFDAISLFDVLEHVTDPRGALETLRQWLRTGGHVVVQVPNSQSLTARIWGRRWPLFLREHLTYFDRRTLGSMLTRVGFEVCALQPVLRSFPVAHLARRLGRFEAAERFLERTGVSAWVVSAPAGELVAVARRRI
jgi:2-polyprenyl-3-methyl-5-hydroxy-6-metoxy-1,4-benzoquinol methylase